MRIRARAVVDQLDRDGERLVLVEEQAVRIGGVAPLLLDLCAQWCTLDDLVAGLCAQFGTPEGADASDLVRHAVRDLAAEGLLELDEEMISP